MQDQGTLRRRILAERRSLSRSQVETWSKSIQERLLCFPEFTGTVALYQPFWNEVMTGALSEVLKAKGGCPVYPEVRGEEMFFATLEGRKVPLADIAMVVLPGVVFSETGHRIGLGRGYYDRTLENYPGRKIGLAYEFQVVRDFIVHSHDVVCHAVVTEQRVIQCG